MFTNGRRRRNAVCPGCGSGRLKRPNGMRRNSDDELRELERAFRRTGAADDAVRLARALIRHGRDRVDTTAFMRSCGVAPVEAHEMVAEATGVPLVEWKLINYGVTGDEESGWDINDLHYTGDKISLPADATYSEVREALVDEGAIRRDLEVDSEASSETNVVFRQPSDQRPAGALERTIRRNPGDEPPVHVRPDGTTTCCNAYSTISADDQVEYCKKCYRAVEGYLDEAVFALPTRVDVAAGHLRCETCSRATGTETRHPMGFKCRRRGGAQENPPLADRDDHRYRYVANCVHAAAEDISAMVESAREITRPYFVRKLAPGEWVEIQKTLGYGPSFPITGDRTISYYRSMFRGQPAVFLEWSAIEYVFTLDGKLGPSAGRDRDALDMRPRSGERGRRRSL